MVHNRYQQRGGEDAVFEAESNLLERHGHVVIRLEFDNTSIPEQRSVRKTAQLALSTVWSRSSSTVISEALERYKPDVVHFHNTFPLVSPSAYYAVRRAGVRTVQTLHNYRLMCPGALLFRDGGPCEDCVGRKVPLPGIRHGCYRDSRAQSATVAAMVTSHRFMGTWDRQIDQYIALTEFSRDKFIEGGLPANKISVKPNFLDSAPALDDLERDSFLFVGRLAESKGIGDLASIWEDRQVPLPLKVAGGGPLEPAIRAAEAATPSIEYLGVLPPAAVLDAMGSARALIYPSTWYENFPMTLVEAFACGLPVIAGRLGAMAEIIEHGRTGLLYAPGDADELIRLVTWAWEHPDELRRMGLAARAEYESKYTGTQNYEMICKIYDWN